MAAKTPVAPPTAKAFIESRRGATKVKVPEKRAAPPRPPAVLGDAVFRYKGELPVYLAHSGQTVVMVRELTPQENEQSGMFLIRAADGWQGHAREGELER